MCWVTIGSNTNLHLTLIYIFSVVVQDDEWMKNSIHHLTGQSNQRDREELPARRTWMPRICIQIRASLNPNVFFIDVKFQCSCQRFLTIFDIGLWVMSTKTHNAWCLRHSMIRWLIGSRNRCVLFAAFLLPGHLPSRLCSSPLLTVFLIHLLWSSGVNTPQWGLRGFNTYFETAIAQTGWCGGIISNSLS